MRLRVYVVKNMLKNVYNHTNIIPIFIFYRILELFYVGASNHGIDNCFGQGSNDSSALPMGRHGWSVLHTACAYNQLEAVKKIIALTDETSEQTAQLGEEQIRKVLNENYAFDIIVNDVNDLISSGTCQVESQVKKNPEMVIKNSRQQ